MRLVPIAEALKLDVGEKIPSTKGKIKSVFDQNSGENDYGQWTIQNVTLIDPNDAKAEIKVKLFNQTEIPKNWKGKILYIESGQGQKGISGVEVVNNEYKGKTSKIIEVREGAVVGLDDGAKRQDEAPQQNQRQPEQRQQTTQQKPATTQQTQQAPAPAPGSFKDQVDCVKKARFALGKAINGLELCVDAAIHLNERTRKKHKDFPGFSPAEIEKIAVHLSIALERGDLRDGLPVGPMDKIFEVIEAEKKARETAAAKQ